MITITQNQYIHKAANSKSLLPLLTLIKKINSYYLFAFLFCFLFLTEKGKHKCTIAGTLALIMNFQKFSIINCVEQ